MSELYEKSMLKLELDQVLALLAECAGSQEGKDACLRLRPTSDLEDVQAMLDETTAASDLCTRKGNPSFGEVHDVSASLERADRGGSLQPKELMRIAGVLRCARTIKGQILLPLCCLMATLNLPYLPKPTHVICSLVRFLPASKCCSGNCALMAHLLPSLC